MIHGERAVERSNARVVEEKCYPYSVPIVLFESIVDFYNQMLAHIVIWQGDSGGANCRCEQILRLGVDMTNGDWTTFIIFSNQREAFDRDAFFVVRRVVWKKVEDIDRIRGSLREDPENRWELLQSWPTVEIDNVAVSFSDAEAVVGVLRRTDELVGLGMGLEETTPGGRRSGEFELARRLAWGEVRLDWGPAMSNAEVQEHILSSMQVLEGEMGKGHEEVSRMELDYVYPLDEFKEHAAPSGDR